MPRVARGRLTRKEQPELDRRVRAADVRVRAVLRVRPRAVEVRGGLVRVERGVVRERERVEVLEEDRGGHACRPGEGSECKDVPHADGYGILLQTREIERGLALV